MTGYFTRLEQELVSAAAREDHAAKAATHMTRGRRGRRRSRRAMLVALAVLVVAGVPAAAVTGIFTPHREPDGLVRLTEPQVIAEDTTRDGRHWELLASQSDVGFCLGIRLPGPPAGGSVVSEGCGGAPPGSLSVATVSGGSIPHNGVALGVAPDEAARVRVEARGVAVTVKTLDDNADLDGRFYVAELPVHESLGHTTVLAFDEDGGVLGKTEIGQRPEPGRGSESRGGRR